MSYAGVDRLAYLPYHRITESRVSRCVQSAGKQLRDKADSKATHVTVQERVQSVSVPGSPERFRPVIPSYRHTRHMTNV